MTRQGGSVSNQKPSIRQRQIRQGISWNVVNLFVNRGSAFLIRLVLAKLLLPEHFGLIAMVMTFLGLIQVFADFGLRNALIQRKRDANSRLRYDSAFWFLAGTGIILTLLFIIIGTPMMIGFYGEPLLKDLVMIMGISILISNLSIVPEIRLTRRMRFKQLVIAEISSTLIASGIAIGMAWNDMGVWALATQQVSAISLRALLIAKFSKWRPRYHFAWTSLQDVIGFSAYMLGVQIIYFIRTNMDNFVVGVLLGASSLGIYTLAYMITENIRQQLSSILTRVLLPVYSRMQTSTHALKSHYLAATRVMALILCPFSLSIVLYAKDIIHVLFNDAWQAAILPTRILALGGMAYALSGPSSEVLQAMGKAKLLFKIAALNICIIGLPLIWILTLVYGIPGAAVAMLITFIGIRLLIYKALKQILDISIKDIIWAAEPAIIATTLVVAFDLIVARGKALLGMPFLIIAFTTITLTYYQHKLKKQIA